MEVPIIVVGAVVYMLPTVNALFRNHANIGAIATLNILLGWTVLGWIGALVWSMTNNLRLTVVKDTIVHEAKSKAAKEIEKKVPDYVRGQEF